MQEIMSPLNFNQKIDYHRSSMCASTKSGPISESSPSPPKSKTTSPISPKFISKTDASAITPF